MTRQILVPLDGSALAEAAVPHAVALACTHDAELTLFRVIAPTELRTTAGWGPVPAPIRTGWVEAALAQLRAELEAVAERLRSIGLVAQTEVLVAGDVASAIIGRAERDPRTLMIVMATHGHSGWQRLWLGSVATKVVRSADLPVLLVRPPHQTGRTPVSASETGVDHVT